MFLLILQLNNLQAPVALRFKTAQAANKQYDVVVGLLNAADRSALFAIADDYGRRQSIYVRDIMTPCVVDYEKDMAGQVDMSVIQARGTVAAQRAQQADPKLLFHGNGVMVPATFRD